MAYRALAAIVCAAAWLHDGKPSSALADPAFPFVSYAAEIDFSEPDKAVEFAALINEIAAHSFVYIDWHFNSAWKSEVFSLLDHGLTESADPEANFDEDICGRLTEELASGDGRVEFAGRPNPDNNHLLMILTVRLVEADPFAIARCEYSGASESLRIRGFFYVTEYRIATANQYEFRPVAVDADRIPAEFFRGQQP
jgi:hypothetical protein